ncbi:MAG: NAD(P)/FAD-dependent oxidoreductase, partial [Pseudonocardiales bacterium]|nr:NAD(P)/FAD-dependent oxidoreductase [Pseudonocardiales bacterium]
MSRAVIVGGGHNGLIAACYLARAGLAVTVLEQADAAGGGSRTEETVPGFRFDTHSAAHNIINMTEIPAELDLAAAGLTYREMDPFAAGFLPDGRVVRFHRSVDATIASIAEHDAAEARRYGEFIERAMPAVEVATAGLTRATSGPAVLRAGLARLGSARRAVRRAGGVGSLVQDVLAPYGGLLAQTLDT